MTLADRMNDFRPRKIGHVDPPEEPALGLAAQAAGPVPGSEGGPVPDDRTAVAMFTVHRLDETAQQLARAAEHLKAARSASGDLRAYHSGHVARHLGDALDAAHLLAANLRQHYPAEGAELDKTTKTIGLARALSESAKTATTAHLVQTVMYDAGHAQRHAQAMVDEPGPGDLWSFNADHAEKHLDGAAEHVAKLREHLEDNYPAEGKWLEEELETIGAQMANPVTIGAQLVDLIGDGHGHHIPGTPMVYRHGWVPISGQAANPVLASQGRFGTVDSLHAHTRPDGTLTPERQALHGRIVESALAGHVPQQHPVATFMGGGPASGKSHLPPGSGPEDSVHIDPDEVKEQLPEYGEMQARGEGSAAAAYTHEESSLISKRIEAEAVARRLNLTLDGVGDSTFENMARRVAAARKAGYQVAGRYVTIDTAEALRRNRTRQAETARWVPEVVIRDKHAKVSRVFPQLVKHGLLDSAELWDNNVPRGASPVLIGSKPPGGQFQVHDPAAYQQFLDKAKDAPT